MIGRLLGLDYGSRRIGVAASDPTGTLASPLTRLEVPADPAGAGLAELVDRLAGLVQNEEAVGVVIGDPRHMSGEESLGSVVVRKLAAALAARIRLPVWLWDERLSSVAAAAALRAGAVGGRARRARVDAAAAAVILQSFLDACRDRPPPAPVPPRGTEGGSKAP
jgi:putative Holliday junction resolvase